MELKPTDLGLTNAADALAWLVAMGADEITLDQPIDRFAESAKVVTPGIPKAAPPPPAPAQVANLSGLNSIADITQALNFLESHPLKKSASKLSFFEGPERADILIIADHPRKEEDRSGLVFADKSRVLLTNMLAAIGLKLEDVALMNLLPWRVLGGATARPADVQAVLPFAKRAVELVQPKFILAVSSLPGQYLADADTSIQRQRGKWLDAGGIPLLATLHPEELLRNPTLKRMAWRDLQLFQEKLK